MGMRITLELDDDDLRHFRLIMREARRAVALTRSNDIVARAASILETSNNEKIPGFVKTRLSRLSVMIDMLTDHEWRLPKDDSDRVLNVLAYLGDVDDLIPDQVPGIGYLDDAIMIELVLRELRHEIEAYEDFCQYRDASGGKRGVKTHSADINREKWLEKRRDSLQDRMRRRQARDADSTGAASLKLLG